VLEHVAHGAAEDRRPAAQAAAGRADHDQLGVGGGLGLLIGGLMILGGALRLYMVGPWRRRG
jgi:hypothetical protein